MDVLFIHYNNGCYNIYLYQFTLLLELHTLADIFNKVASLSLQVTVCDLLSFEYLYSTVSIAFMTPDLLPLACFK